MGSAPPNELATGKNLKLYENLLEGHDYKQGSMGRDGTGRYGNLGNIIRRRLRWMGHVARMEGKRRAIQAMTRVRRASVYQRQTAKELAGNYT